MSAPIAVPPIFPTPPDMLVSPSTTAAMASISAPCPAVGWPANIMDARTISYDSDEKIRNKSVVTGAMPKLDEKPKKLYPERYYILMNSRFGFSRIESTLSCFIYRQAGICIDSSETPYFKYFRGMLKNDIRDNRH
jgi:hypothetical protein